MGKVYVKEITVIYHNKCWFIGLKVWESFKVVFPTYGFLYCLFAFILHVALIFFYYPLNEIYWKKITTFRHSSTDLIFSSP